MKDQDQALQAAQEALDASLRAARATQSAHDQARTAIRDASTLRLTMLHDELKPRIAARRETSDFIDLALIAGDEPRLWIDLTSYIVMAPDPRTYRLVQDTRDGPQTLLETADRAEMLQKATEFVAHRTIIRQQQLPTPPVSATSLQGRYSTSALLLAWLTGLSFGVLALLLAGALLSP